LAGQWLRRRIGARSWDTLSFRGTSSRAPPSITKRMRGPYGM